MTHMQVNAANLQVKCRFNLTQQQLKSHFQLSCIAQYSQHENPVNNITCFWLANHLSPLIICEK